MNRNLLLALTAGVLLLLTGTYFFQRYRIHSITQAQITKFNIQRAEAIAKHITELRNLASDPKAPDLKPRYQQTIAIKQGELRKLGLDQQYPEAMRTP